MLALLANLPSDITFSDDIEAESAFAEDVAQALGALALSSSEDPRNSDDSECSESDPMVESSAEAHRCQEIKSRPQQIC